MQRETKDAVAELVGKLGGKLDAKALSGSPGKERARGGRPNLEGLTVGVDLGDQWSRYCILGLDEKTLSKGQLGTKPQEFTRRDAREKISRAAH